MILLANPELTDNKLVYLKLNLMVNVTFTAWNLLEISWISHSIGESAVIHRCKHPISIKMPSVERNIVVKEPIYENYSENLPIIHNGVEAMKMSFCQLKSKSWFL